MPGEFRTVIEFFRARPDLGLTCASKPLGSSIENPAGIKAVVLDLMIIFFSIAAIRSKPALSSVAFFKLYSSKPFSKIL